MHTLIHNKYIGNLKLINIISRINLNHIKPSFEKLDINYKYLIKKQILWIRKNENNLYEKGNIQQNEDNNKYPLINIDNKLIIKLLDIFTEESNTRNNKNILLQFNRITSTQLYQPYYNYNYNMNEGIDKQAIICVNRYNIYGGISELKNKYNKKIKLELSPGYMIIYDNDNIEYKETEMICGELDTIGYKDIILISSFKN